MNKIATYLNQHLLGEASSSKAARRRLSTDGSILTITPEIVVFPRVTNDIRKVARFTWQLAEKGHPMGVTVRGRGADTTGGAIGKGVVVSTAQYLTNIVAVASKERLVHVQAGMTLESLNQALNWQGMALTHAPADPRNVTVGGAIAGNAFGPRGAFGEAIEKLEVVLANGDVIETGRVSRNEVNKKQGLQTFEGELYRKLAGLIEDNEELIAQLAQDPTPDATGYKGIASIRQKDGSFDLTPLFVGSQGTLGIITEAVLRTEFYSLDTTYGLIALESAELARDLADRLTELEPSQLITIDAPLLNRAAQYGKTFSLTGDQSLSGAIVVIAFNDISERNRQHKLKKLRKLIDKMSLTLIDSTDHDDDGFVQLLEVPTILSRLADDDNVSLPILDGSYVPQDRREECAGLIAELAAKHRVELDCITNALTGTITVYPQLKLHAVSDKQKLFRLMNDYAAIIERCGGAFVSEGAEGRVKANAAWSTLKDDEVALYEQVRQIFDPFGTLNPGVKQTADLRTVVSHLRSSYDTTDFLA